VLLVLTKIANIRLTAMWIMHLIVPKNIGIDRDIFRLTCAAEMFLNAQYRRKSLTGRLACCVANARSCGQNGAILA